MTAMPCQMLERAQALQPWLCDTYQALHRVPELDRSLPETTAIVKAKLDEMSIPWRDCAGGILAELTGASDRPCIALRADMDALPIQEETGLPYASCHAGIMHACGHDAHTTCALGALRLLQSVNASRRASLRVLFQPAEETEGGAAAMIADGALSGVQNGLCLHVSSSLKAGAISVASGQSCAASDMFNVTLHGTSSHGASPHTGIDCIAAGAQLITALQTLVSRETDPLDAAVVTVGKFVSGTARNIIPETARLEGIIRTLTPETRLRMRARFCELVQNVAAALRVTADIEIIQGYPALISDPTFSAQFFQSAAALIGNENVRIQPKPSMGVDDFAYIAEALPSCHVYFGCAADPATAACAHNPRFRVEDVALITGAALEAQFICDVR